MSWNTVHARRCYLVLLVIVTSLLASMSIVAYPRISRFCAAEMLARAVTTTDPELEASPRLASAISWVERCGAQREAGARLIPLLDVRNELICLRARYCLGELNARSPDVIAALVAIYRDPTAPPEIRLDVAGELVMLSREDAAACGAESTWRQVLARHPDRAFNKNDSDLLPAQ